MGPRIIGLLFEDADLGLRADEANIEPGALDDHPGADDGNHGRGDPGPFDAAQRAKHQPIERHECDQIGGQAEHDETCIRHFDAGCLAEGDAGGVGGGAEIVPRPDAAGLSGGRYSRTTCGTAGRFIRARLNAVVRGPGCAWSSGEFS